MKTRWGKVTWFAVITVMLAVLLIPIGIALAESFGYYDTVQTDAGDVIGDAYQRHSFIAEDLHWVFYSTDSKIYYTSSADAATWATPTEFSDFECTAVDCCNGSVFSLWYDEPSNFVDVAYMNVTDSNTAIYYVRGTPVSDGTITWAAIQTAVNASVGISYTHPSICDNTLDYPFIAYMATNGSAYYGNISTSATNDSTWGFATNTTISSLLTFNISANVLYPSVVPVSDGNISLMVVFVNGSDYLLAQNYADYDVASDTWSYPSTIQFPLPATSVIDVDDISYHSEVGWSGNVTNTDDVFAICMANDSVIGQYMWSDNYGDPALPWISDVALDTGYYYGTIGVRNALGDLAVTAIEITQKTDLYNADYDMTAGSWDTLAVIAGVDATSGDRVQSDYDNAATDYLGTLYYDNMVALVPDLEYGCYGCSEPAATSTDPGTTIMQVVIPLLIAITVVVLALKGIGEVNTVSAIIILMLGTIIGVITFFVIKTLVLGL
jgi:hypothetical protein